MPDQSGPKTEMGEKGEQIGEKVGYAAGKQGTKMALEAGGEEFGVPPQVTDMVDKKMHISDKGGQIGAQVGGKIGGQMGDKMADMGMGDMSGLTGGPGGMSGGPGGLAEGIGGMSGGPGGMTGGPGGLAEGLGGMSGGPKPEAPKPEAPKPEAPKPEAPKPEAPKPEAPKPSGGGSGESPDLSQAFQAVTKSIEGLTKIAEKLADPIIKGVSALTNTATGAIDDTVGAAKFATGITGLSNANNMSKGMASSITGSDGPSGAGDGVGQSLSGITSDIGGTAKSVIPTPTPGPDSGPSLPKPKLGG
jgi:hypothetical protein